MQAEAFLTNKPNKICKTLPGYGLWIINNLLIGNNLAEIEK